MIAYNFQKISHFWKSIWLSNSFLMPLVYGFKIINMDSHILFFFSLPPTPVSFVHNSNKINPLLLQMMLPNLTHEQRRPGAKICSILLCYSFVWGCKLAVTPQSSQVFFGPSTKNCSIRKGTFRWPGMSNRQRAFTPEKRRAHLQLHPHGCHWTIPSDAESRVLYPAARDKVSKYQIPLVRSLRRGVGGRKGAWGLSCSVLDTEPQAQPQTWLLSEEMRQGMCQGTGRWEEREHFQACVGQGGVSAVLSVIFLGLGFCEGDGWAGWEDKEKKRED